MRFKRLAALALSGIMCIGIAGCGGNASSNSEGESAPETTPAAEVTGVNDVIDTELTALEFTAGIDVGWNLGNTFDSTGSGPYSETSWGNPITTEDMFLTVKEAGFNAIRIPTTWEKHMDENYNIDPQWMARVTEVVDYAYKNDMYVILNMHHEEWYLPYEVNKEAASSQLAACWKQIAENFKGYDEKLIFEGMNEPRWKNTEWEWNGGNDEGRAVVNHFNKVFVDTVRATGGNNEKRFLMICPYAANSGEPALSALELPDDDRIIVSVHAYIPYNFALQENGSKRWVQERQSAEIDALAEVLDRLFISKGIAVIMGECGAMSRDNDEFRTAWAEYYFGKFKEIGVPCFLWDNMAFYSGETFGMLDRRSLYWKYPTVVEGIMKGAGVTDYTIKTKDDI